MAESLEKIKPPRMLMGCLLASQFDDEISPTNAHAAVVVLVRSESFLFSGSVSSRVGAVVSGDH